MSAPALDVPGGLRVAHPALVLERGLQTRRDWKFLVTLEDASALVDVWSQSHAALAAGDRLWARYHTTYIDTADFQSYRDHARQRPRRTKFRYRDYADRHLTYLECKQRGPRGATHKLRVEVPYRRRVPGVELPASWPSALPPDPTLEVSFRRLSLVHCTAPERVTIDVALRWQSTNLHTLDHVAVVEVKSAQVASRTDSMRALRGRHLHARSFSKYCVGLALVEPAVNPAPFRASIKHLARLETPCPPR